MQFSSLGSSNMEISETCFFDTLTIQKDQISLLCKACFSPSLCVFHPIWVLGGGGGAPKGSGAQPADAVFWPQQLKKWKFPKLIFLIL